MFHIVTLLALHFPSGSSLYQHAHSGVGGAVMRGVSNAIAYQAIGSLFRAFGPFIGIGIGAAVLFAFSRARRGPGGYP
jgi:hypothetical protein